MNVFMNPFFWLGMGFVSIFFSSELIPVIKRFRIAQRKEEYVEVEGHIGAKTILCFAGVPGIIFSVLMILLCVFRLDEIQEGTFPSGGFYVLAAVNVIFVLFVVVVYINAFLIPRK